MTSETLRRISIGASMVALAITSTAAAFAVAATQFREAIAPIGALLGHIWRIAFPAPGIAFARESHGRDTLAGVLLARTRSFVARRRQATYARHGAPLSHGLASCMRAAC